MVSVLKKEKNYNWLFFSGLVNGVGDRFSQVAVLTMLLELTGSGLAVGAALSIRIFPYLFFSFAGGVMSERLSRKKMMVITDVMRVPLALSLLLVNEPEHIWIIYVVLFFLAVGEAVYEPVRKSFIYEILHDRKHVARVNVMEQSMLGFVLVFGSVFGGVFSYLMGPKVVFIINGVSFLMATLLLLNITDDRRPTLKPKHIKVSVREELKLVKKAFHQNPVLRNILLLELTVPFASGLFNVLISIYAIQVFHGEDLGVGLFYGALGLGLILNSFVSFHRYQNLFTLALVALIFEGLMQILVSQSFSIWMAVVLLTGVSFFGGIGNSIFDTLLMKLTPADHQGAVFGVTSMVSNVIISLSMFAGGVWLEWIDPRHLGLIAGSLFIVFAIIFLVSQKKMITRQGHIEMNGEQDKLMG